jgi:hypothetical protein
MFTTKKYYWSIVFVFLIGGLAFHTSSVAQTTPDPGLLGTYTVSKDTFDLGELAYKPDSFPNFVELRGSVHYPTSLVGGPFPVIVLLHGRHSTTYKTSAPGTTSLSWPPATGYQSIISFDGYDYFARTMASHGYIVISVSCNAINAADASLSDRGMNARGQLVQKHLDLWKDYNTIGGIPFGSKFVGKLDMTRIGTMGHSRGGEGVVYHALLNKAKGSPYGIKAVITLAPVDFYRKKLNGIPLLNIAPYCDGDVSDLQGVHFYDDVRYNDTADTAPKYSILMMGANHNYFNTVWTPGSYIAGTSDDWGTTDPFCGSSVVGNGRLDTTKQKAAFNAYGAAFFRMHVGGDTSFAPILEVDDIYPPASSKLDTTQVYVSFHPGKNKRKDINRVDTSSNISSNTLAGLVTQSGLLSSLICGGGYTVPLCGISTAQAKEPHRGSTTIKGLAQMSMRWNNATDYYQNEIPLVHQNTTMYGSLSFRTTQNYKETTPIGRDLDFTVVLEDSNGKTSSQVVSKYSGALFYQPGTRTNILPKTMFNTVKIPLIKFKGINQTKLKYIRFLFNAPDSGSVLVSDIALVGNVKPCGIIDAKFKDSLGKGYNVFFKDSTLKNTDDLLVWKWKFGDLSSGASDSSNIQHPTHYFSGSGAYNVCLYVWFYRTTGLVCKDTFCKTITLLPNSINEQNVNHITISPNPASDYILINGALPADVLELRNLCGQTVLNTHINQPRISLPTSLPNGMYIALIHSERGEAVQKVMLVR